MRGDLKMDRTFVMIKPDGVARGLIGEVVRRLETKGLTIGGMKMLHIDEELAGTHYEIHRGKPFYDTLMEYITSGPSVAMAVEGDGAVGIVRTIVGATDPKKAIPGTIRGDLAMDIGRNVVHASDSEESAARELGLFFDDGEILDHDTSDRQWLYE